MTQMAQVAQQGEQGGHKIYKHALLPVEGLTLAGFFPLTGGGSRTVAYHLEYPVVLTFQLGNTFHPASPPIVFLTHLPPANPWKSPPRN